MKEQEKCVNPKCINGWIIIGLKSAISNTARICPDCKGTGLKLKVEGVDEIPKRILELVDKMFSDNSKNVDMPYPDYVRMYAKQLYFILRQSIGREVIGKAVEEISEWYGYYSAEDEGLSKRVDDVLEKLEQKIKEIK